MKGAGIKGAGKLTDEQKLKIYPAIIGLLGIGLTASLLSHFEVQIWTEAGSPQRLPEAERSPIIQSPRADSPSARSSSSSPSSPLPSPVESTSPAPQPSPAAASAIAVPGSLRVSNQTDYPVRVALLPKQPGTLAPNVASQSSSSSGSGYQQPVHWDFAPQEGELKGLRLSLPDGKLKIQTGDILVAFAQDGSRRYWGPYVVGQTLMPAWNKVAQEWQLNLQP